MGLNKHKLGELIELCELKNNNLEYNLDDFKGISIQKKFIETKANMEGVSLKPYYLVKPDFFAYVTVTSRNGEKITLAHNTTNKTYIVSSSYVVFKVKETNLLDSDYLFMYFNRPEFDRYARYNSWGSARETFSWEDMCDINIELPPLWVQKKYVRIYKNMILNHKNCVDGLDDLKLVCDAYIEGLRKKYKPEPIEKYIREINNKNTDGKVKLTQGIDVSMQFIPAKREAEDQESAKVVETGQFAFNKVVKCGGTKLPIALRKGPRCVISGSYSVFEVIDKTILHPDYLMMWLSRSETHRYCGFNAWGSTRDVFPFEELCKLEFPIPPYSIQKSIVDIYNVYNLKKALGEKMKFKISSICPILIKGAIEEGKRIAEV